MLFTTLFLPSSYLKLVKTKDGVVAVTALGLNQTYPKQIN